MKTFNNEKHRQVIHLKFRGTFFTSFTKLLLEVKTSVCSTIKENLLLFCRKFLAFVIVIII